MGHEACLAAHKHYTTAALTLSGVVGYAFGGKLLSKCSLLQLLLQSVSLLGHGF